MKYMAILDDDFLQYFRRDDNGMTLVVDDRDGLNRAVRLLPLEERPHGEWIRKTDGLPHLITLEWFICSECGVQKSEATPFCPNCGASKMKEGEAE